MRSAFLFCLAASAASVAWASAAPVACSGASKLAVDENTLAPLESEACDVAEVASGENPIITVICTSLEAIEQVVQSLPTAAADAAAPSPVLVAKTYKMRLNALPAFAAQHHMVMRDAGGQ